MYEHRTHRLLSRGEFASRVARHLWLALLILAFGLGIGILGYHFLAGLSWTDSLLNASMILGGMGPVDPLQGSVAKLFAAFYALFSGLAFIGVTSVLVAPFAHRLLHSLHVDQRER
jgi:flagellar biosynthesis protein FliR